MEYKLNEKVFKDIEIDLILKELSNLININKKIKNELIFIFKNTKDHKIEHVISLLFADLNDETIILVLLDKISNLKYSNYNDTLIYACSEYDCSSHLSFFVDLIIDLNDSAYIQAINVLENMKKPIKLKDKLFNIKKLSEYLSKLNHNDDKYNDIVYSVKIINRINSIDNQKYSL